MVSSQKSLTFIFHCLNLVYTTRMAMIYFREGITYIAHNCILLSYIKKFMYCMLQLILPNKKKESLKKYKNEPFWESILNWGIFRSAHH